MKRVYAFSKASWDVQRKIFVGIKFHRIAHTHVPHTPRYTHTRLGHPNARGSRPEQAIMITQLPRNRSNRHSNDILEADSQSQRNGPGHDHHH